MSSFPDVRAAKEFLIGHILAEAQLQCIPISTTERKMLYYSETGWSLPDIKKIGDRFDREYDQQAYEYKIGRIVRSLRTRLRKRDPQQWRDWNNAIDILRAEDHYLLVLISPKVAAPARPWSRPARLAAIAVGVFFVIVLIAALVLTRTPHPR